MATIKLGAMVTDMRGSIGGTIFSRNANASYAKNFTKPINPSTGGQQSIRGIFSAISQQWRLLEDSQRAAWTAAAPDFPYTNKVGEQSVYTGSQLFNALNGARIQLNPAATILQDPPTPISLTAIYAMTGVTELVSGVLNIELTINGGTDLPGTSQKALVMATRGVSQGVYRPKRSDFRVLGAYEVSATGVIDGPAGTAISAAYIAKYSNPRADEAIWFMVETIEPLTGQKIPGTMIKCTVV